MKEILLSFSSIGRENYNHHLLRLLDSSLEFWKGDYLIYSPDHDLSEYKGIRINKGYPSPRGIKSYTHDQMPYQFKVAMIQQAIELGYKKIVWLDSSMQMKRDILPLFGEGITVFHNLGHPLYKYISDRAVMLLESEFRTEALSEIEQIWGGALFFDFNYKSTQIIFEKLKKHSVDGSFKTSGSIRQGFVAHRHDQAIMSVLVHKKCRMMPYGAIICPPHDTTGEYGTDYYLLCR